MRSASRWESSSPSAGGTGTPACRHASTSRSRAATWSPRSTRARPASSMRRPRWSSSAATSAARGSSLPTSPTSTSRSRAAAPTSCTSSATARPTSTDQILRLEEPDTLRAQQIRAMPGLAKACREHHPLVFLNALRGRAAGARAGRRVGVRPVVHRGRRELHRRHAVERRRRDRPRGRDRVLRDAARRPRTSFAEALRAIRARGYAQPGEDSYAAYCFYGDPTAGLP